MPIADALFEVPLPTLDSARLTLRAFVDADAETVEARLSDPEVSRHTLTIPYPYPPGSATPWIATHAEAWSTGKSGTWAITWKSGGGLVGAISLRLTRAHHRAEVGYWVSREEWGKGIATEAARRLVAFAFDELGLHRVDAHHFVENPASGRVLVRAGMRAEGTRRGAVFRDGVARDLVEYAILRTDQRP